MVFRTAGMIATLLISVSSEASAQYYPPSQSLPPAVNPRPLPPLNTPVVQEDHPVPPAGVAPPPSATAYPGNAGALPSAGTPSPTVHPQDYGPDAVNPYGLRGAIAPSPPGSAQQDAIRERAVRSGQQNGPDQIGSAPIRPSVTVPIQGGGLGNLAALPPEVRPETGPNKELAPQFRRTLISYRTKEPVGTIIIDTPNTYLYLVLREGKALRYGIGVGREGFTWSGVERVTRMLQWPDWTPPEEMILRQPYLPRFMAGGETNPLGARALYLGGTVYRIHGTNQPSTIGTFVSSGCIRLTNEDVMDLYRRVGVGTRVVVLPGRAPQGTSLAPVTLRAQSGLPSYPPSVMAR